MSEEKTKNVLELDLATFSLVFFNERLTLHPVDVLANQFLFLYTFFLSFFLFLYFFLSSIVLLLK